MLLPPPSLTPLPRPPLGRGGGFRERASEGGRLKKGGGERERMKILLSS